MRSKYKYHFIVLLSGISWSTLSIFTAFASKLGINPFNQVFWRIFIGLLTSFFIAKFIFKKNFGIDQKSFIYFVINAFLFFFGFTTFSSSIYLGTPIAKAIALNYSYPLAVIVLSYILFKHIPSKKNILAIVISFISVLFLFEIWSVKNITQINIGDFLAWINSFAFAGIIVWGTKIRKYLKTNPFITLFYSWLVAIPLLIVCGFLINRLGIPLFYPIVKTNFGIQGWLSLLGLGTISSVLPISLMYFASSKLKPFVTSILLLSEPVVVYLAGIVLFGQVLSVWGFLGMVGIMISVVLT